MATVTALAAQAGVQPRGNHSGVDAVKMTHELSSVAVLAAADIVLFGKIPNGSTIVAIEMRPTAGAGNNFTISLGTTDGGAFGSVTAAAVGDLTTNLPYTVSLSDDASPQHAYLRGHVNVVTSATVLGIIGGTVWMTRDY